MTERAPSTPVAPGADSPKPSSPLLLGLLIAAAIGGAIAGAAGGKPVAEAVGWLGHLFLDALRMVVVPLVMASLICGISAIGDVRGLGRAGFVAVVYFLGTMLVAVCVGLFLVTFLRPGEGAGPGTLTAAELAKFNEKAGVGISDFARGFVHPSIVDAMAKTMILPCIVFSLAFGAALTTLGERGRAVLVVVDGINEALLRVVTWLIWLAPVGIFGLVAWKIGDTGGGAAAMEAFRRIGSYMVVVIVGLVIHGAVVLPLLLKFLGGRNPFSYARGMLPALVTAFSTASSSATLPVTMECIAENGVSRKAAGFLAPLGATLNMNGTALYEAVAAVFIAQAYGIDLGVGALFVVAFMATLAAVGAAGIPEAGLVTMVLVLQAVGLPLEGMGLILAVDWFLDRCRTAVNVWDDGVGAAILERVAFREGLVTPGE